MIALSLLNPVDLPSRSDPVAGPVRRAAVAFGSALATHDAGDPAARAAVARAAAEVRCKLGRPETRPAGAGHGPKHGDAFDAYFAVVRVAGDRPHVVMAAALDAFEALHADPAPSSIDPDGWAAIHGAYAALAGFFV